MPVPTASATAASGGPCSGGGRRIEPRRRRRRPRGAPLSDLWRVRDSNPRRLRRLIYSQIPLAAWVTRRVRTRPACTVERRLDHLSYVLGGGSCGLRGVIDVSGGVGHRSAPFVRAVGSSYARRVQARREAAGVASAERECYMTARERGRAVAEMTKAPTEGAFVGFVASEVPGFRT